MKALRVLASLPFTLTAFVLATVALFLVSAARVITGDK